jgi:hypothetical protein
MNYVVIDWKNTNIITNLTMALILVLFIIVQQVALDIAMAISNKSYEVKICTCFKNNF